MASSPPSLPAAGEVQKASPDVASSSSHHKDDGHRNSDIVRVKANAEKKTGPERKSAIRRTWHYFTTVVADSWALEWASLFCSVVLLVGLIVLFRIFEGHPTTTWPAALSFTTVIAIMSKAIQTTLMLPVAASISQLGWVHFYRPRALVDFQTFDAASRGLLGSVSLLIALPSVWAVLSALLAVVALGIEAAAQQCLQSTATSYVPVLGTIIDLGFWATDGAYPNFGMLNAGVAAMTTKDAVLQHPFTTPSSRTETVLPETLLYRCLTAGCQPSPYVTLGLCSTCEDVSETLVIQDWCAQSSGNDDESCGVYIPGGPSLHVQTQGLALKATPIMPTNLWQPGRLLLANFTMVEQMFPSFPSIAFDQPLRFAAQTCIIVLCANIYQLDVTAGDTGVSGATESLLASFERAAYWSELEYIDRPGHAIVVPAHVDMTTADGKSTHWQGGTTTLGMDVNSTVYLRQYFQSLFTGEGSSPIYDINNQASEERQLAATVAQQQAGTALWDRLAYTLWEYKIRDRDDLLFQVNTVIKHVTASMGNWLRDFYASSQEKGKHGLGYGNNIAGYYDPAFLRRQSDYRIRWIWLMIPAIAEVLGLIQLCTAISLTRAYKVPIWKSSALATMHHGITSSDEASDASFQRLSVMKDAADARDAILASSAVECRLFDTEDGQLEVARWLDASKGAKHGGANKRRLHESFFWF